MRSDASDDFPLALRGPDAKDVGLNRRSPMNRADGRRGPRTAIAERMGTEILLPIGFLGALILLGALALRFGRDSRDGISTPPQPPLGGRVDRR
jgi:hypothetical protein